MVLNPALFFILIWIFQLFGYFIYRASFGGYQNETIATVIIGAGFFLTGCCASYILLTRKKFISSFQFLTYFESLEKIDLTKFVILFCFFYVFYGCYNASALYEQITIAGMGNLHSFADIRAVINYDFNNKRYFYGYFRYFQLGIVAIVFLFSFAKQISKKWLAVLFFLGLVSVVITTSRLFLLFYILSIIGILASYSILNAKQIFLGIIAFLILFFGIAVIVKKGYNLTDPFEILKWNIQVYLFSPLAAFNHFIETGEPAFNTVLIIPNAVKKLLLPFGVDMGLRSNLMPFVDVPLRTNVYTYLYPLYHDGGKILVAFISFVLGFLHQTIYIISKRFRNPLTVYIFCISIYPLALTFFEDAYFSSPGFLLFQIIPVALCASGFICFKWITHKYGVKA